MWVDKVLYWAYAGRPEDYTPPPTTKEIVRDEAGFAVAVIDWERDDGVVCG